MVKRRSVTPSPRARNKRQTLDSTRVTKVENRQMYGAVLAECLYPKEGSPLHAQGTPYEVLEVANEICDAVFDLVGNTTTEMKKRMLDIRDYLKRDDAEVLRKRILNRQMTAQQVATCDDLEAELNLSDTNGSVRTIVDDPIFENSPKSPELAFKVRNVQTEPQQQQQPPQPQPEEREAEEQKRAIRGSVVPRYSSIASLEASMIKAIKKHRSPISGDPFKNISRDDIIYKECNDHAQAETPNLDISQELTDPVSGDLLYQSAREGTTGQTPPTNTFDIEPSNIWNAFATTSRSVWENIKKPLKTGWRNLYKLFKSTPRQ